MRLLQIEEIFPPRVDLQSNVVQYTAKMQKTCNTEADQAVLATNINILRRSVPFAYLFVDSYHSFQEWLDDEFGDDPDREYVSSFDAITLKQSISLYDPSSRAVKGTSIPPTIIVAILTKDILPFIHTMECQEFPLLCLPTEFLVTDLENMIQSTHCDTEVTDRFLDVGGIFISIPDGIVLTAISKKADLQRHFSLMN